MNEIEIDQNYIDEKFVNHINNLDSDKFAGVFNYILENYETDFSHEKLTNFSKVISSFSLDIDPNHFLRQIKYLINKGTYNRLLKKYKNDLLALNFTEEKIDLMVELQRGFIDNLNQMNKKNEEDLKNVIVKDFEIKTEMPVFNTNYLIKSESGLNEDLKKQNLSINFDLQCNSENENANNLIVQMDKAQLVNFFEEIEKIQEKLDKLY